MTVATVDPDIWRALRKVESITAFTRNMPASDAPCTARPTYKQKIDINEKTLRNMGGEREGGGGRDRQTETDREKGGGG